MDVMRASIEAPRLQLAAGVLINQSRRRGVAVVVGQIEEFG